MTRTLRVACVLLTIAAVLTAGTACRRGSRGSPTDPVMDVFNRHDREEGLTRVQTDGKRLFVHYCATCHGDAGQGDGQNAYNLDPKPPSFLESLNVHQPSYWRQLIEGGSAAVGRSPQCPPWGHTLASSDLDALVAYLGVLANPPSPLTAPGEPAPSTPPER